jgi:hypothetical protein
VETAVSSPGCGRERLALATMEPNTVRTRSSVMLSALPMRPISSRLET